MVITGLEKFRYEVPRQLRKKRLGVLCHAPSITSDFTHVIEVIINNDQCTLGAVFGPQHGLFGETQDNMIEWEGIYDPRLGVPVFSLYGATRRPTSQMLANIDALIVDVQDVGARLYTYIWTVKHCMEACSEAGIPVWILDRPNPVGLIGCDGPVLKEEYFTFVGGASIPLCHSMTTGEMALWIREKYIPRCDLHIIKMEGWTRRSLYSDTGLPWVLPSPNLPTLNSALVYPGTVLIEALNISEGRGTTTPFELFGAPWLNATKLVAELLSRRLPGCTFRVHNFIPTFNKYANELCEGIQIHVTEPSEYKPVQTALHIFDALMNISGSGHLKFNLPPYEYEEVLMPFDILSGDNKMRLCLENRLPVEIETERWIDEIAGFLNEFETIRLYD
jgi:uncharacterized protein YbbC (DUF1343 family)